jgi:hypothetical protein
MYVVDRITESGLERYSSIVPRSVWSNFQASKTSTQPVIVGATLFREPVGVAIACRRLGYQDVADVYSLHVSRRHRRMGVGTRLVRRLERELFERGFRACEFYYMAERPEGRAYEGLLAKSGWEPPAPCAYFCETDHERLLPAPWMRLTLSDSFEIFPWRQLSSQEREYIGRRKSDGWFPEPLDPFFHGDPADPVPGSLGLRFKGQLAGWSIAVRVEEGVLGCRSLFVDPSLQTTARAVALLAESIRRTSGYRYVFDVCFERERMRQFVDRRMIPYLTSIRRSNRMVKRLASNFIRIGTTEGTHSCLAHCL